MARNFYLDTSIWRDYFEDRTDGLRPLGEFAFQFLKNCKRQRRRVFYSNLVVQELRADYSEEKIGELFLPFGDVLVKVPLSNEQISEARAILSSVTGTHLKDIIHAVLARDNCAVMITRDRHFDALTGFVEIAKPEDVHF